MSKRREIPVQNIQEVEVFDCWGIDFIRPLPMSLSHEYILLVVEYVSRWVEVVPAQHANAKTMIKFLKRHIFCKFGTPRILISDRSSHFCNSSLQRVLEHYGVRHKVVIAYHPQTNGLIVQGLVNQARGSFAGIQDSIQNTNWFVSILIDIWEGLSFTCGIRAQGLLGFKALEF